jgi:hypothetical protein
LTSPLDLENFAVRGKKKKKTSSPPPLGWPIRKAQVSKSSAVSDMFQAKQKQSHLADSKLKKMCSKNSGLLYICLVSKKL